MKITRENLASEYDNYKSMLKDDEMRSKVRETIDDLLEFYGEDEGITKAVDAIVELVNKQISKSPKNDEPVLKSKFKTGDRVVYKGHECKVMEINGNGSYNLQDESTPYMPTFVMAVSESELLPAGKQSGSKSSPVKEPKSKKEPKAKKAPKPKPADNATLVKSISDRFACNKRDVFFHHRNVESHLRHCKTTAAVFRKPHELMIFRVGKKEVRKICMAYHDSLRLTGGAGCINHVN